MENPSQESVPAEMEKRAGEIQAAAEQLGFELNAQEAARWIFAASRAEHNPNFEVDLKEGVFGNPISLLDFDPQELDFFRRLGRIVRLEADPRTESALAIAGSAAQGKIQLFPGDNDFFERVNIKTGTLEEARALLTTLVRRTALRALAQPGVVLINVDFGAYSQEVVERGWHCPAGHYIQWTPNGVLNGSETVETPDGRPVTVRWEELQGGLGHTLFNWIVSDPDLERILLVSNMVDATWEAPDGKLTPLDGAIDPCFQEIYIESQDLPVFKKVIRQVDPQAMRGYAEAMRHQIVHYSRESPNYGKVAKRLYNLFRVTDQLEAAAFVRELFDEPTAQLYQVPSLLQAADIAVADPQRIGRSTVVRQIDTVIRAVREIVQGRPEEELLDQLKRLRLNVAQESPEETPWSELLEEVNKRCLELVNSYFRERLLGYPAIGNYFAQLGQ